MTVAACSDADFIRLIRELGTRQTAIRLQVAERNVLARRKRLERKYGESISGPSPKSQNRNPILHPARLHLSIPNGIVLVGSDAHIWPGPISVAMRAFIKFCKELRPRVVVMNGDAMDFPGISRHPPLGWEKMPTVQEEIEAAQVVLRDIETAVPKGCELAWPLGNHDARLEARIVQQAPELAGIQGVSLKDHFGPRWQPCYSVWINDVVVKHRIKGGIHAAHNNTMWAGKSVVTGHLHSLKVTPFTDYNGSRFGVDTGCLADTFGLQFNYMEDNPRNWRAGFVVLTFRDGRLMWPEVVHVLDDCHVEFRSEVIKV